ncbi:helix-turn-helix domain-containing protein [Listeria seeligeri]|uniref:helix-turn-helix domain-containing protein n=1 Tax=Listeria seeligeri TaxID=1640 RepID=UPI0010D51739|nr:helix-turn-helix transcriptional regulator [Listeria seeligeri]EAD3672169.1 XRE family transcriptional regulator [Listeria monocytogenes]EJZ0334618.1 helix-turn-helix transcriptional regulator [Listeria monocytogenes]EJZ0534182.1 helix-turn-helix transcriptional regulator [Listeria monocytogenes]EKH9261038.1 helix-turn-helix transcriptional regulator [Listeria monocytogenes]MBC1775837.1 helix-turn-helix transcriptional regulator [Listeria seeligeri]
MFSERLKKLRLDSKMTQTDLGNKINVTKAAISGYENGIRTPDTDTLQMIADIFGVSIDYLLGRPEPKNQNSEGFTPKEEKDMKKRMDALRKDLKNGDGLLYDGEPISEEAMESILEAMEFAEKQATRINRKYAPKNRKNNIE